MGRTKGRSMSTIAPLRHAIDIVPEALEGSLNVDAFKAAFRNHPAGVALVTGDSPRGPVALTLSSVSSISTEPPLLIFSVSAMSSSSPALEEADTVIVHMLGADQLDLAKLGATSGIDRFADTSAWYRLPTGEVVFRGADAWIRGRVIHRLEAGNSIVYVVHALDASVPPSDEERGRPLVYHNRTWHELGSDSVID